MMWERLAPDIAETLVRARLAEAEQRALCVLPRRRANGAGLGHAIAARLAAAIHTEGPCCAAASRRPARQGA